MKPAYVSVDQFFAAQAAAAAAADTPAAARGAEVESAGQSAEDAQLLEDLLAARLAADREAAESRSVSVA